MEDALSWTHTTEILYMFNYEPGEVDGGIPDDYYDGGPLPSDICSSATQKQV